ncbi:hypothetical protein N9W89_08485 [Hellea sp.]|nr:hypothetical protein [Hellea sp.]
MDTALIKKIDVYSAGAALDVILPKAESKESTLIKADISLFHEIPSVKLPLEEPSSGLSNYDVGFEKGQAKADAVYKDAIKVMQTALDNLQAEMGSIAQQIEASHLSALATCLRAVFPSLMQGGTDLELQTLLQKACGSTLKGQIQLRVHPDDQTHCEELCADQDIDITVDKTLAPLQMSLHWTGGGANIDCQAAATFCLSQLNAALNQSKE